MNLVSAEVEYIKQQWHVTKAGFSRTARRLMQGDVFISKA